MTDNLILDHGLDALKTEIDGFNVLYASLRSDLGHNFIKAVELIAKIKGRIIVTGMGKSGHVSGKIAATLASTGTPAFFIHPGEASHGDLGMITADDLVIALSWSGETIELRNVILYARRLKVPMIAITSQTSSSLAKAATIALLIPKVHEACPNGLAPTTSALLQMAMGDLLAVTLLKKRGFSSRDFKEIHPGGSLGAYLTTIDEIMHTGDALPIITPDTLMRDAIIVMSRKGFGCLIVIDDEVKITGIVTDGDLRRHLNDDLLSMTVGAIMTKEPKLVMRPDTLISDAMARLNQLELTSLLVAADGKLLGLVHIHDILRSGIK